MNLETNKYCYPSPSPTTDPTCNLTQSPTRGDRRASGKVDTMAYDQCRDQQYVIADQWHLEVWILSNYMGIGREQIWSATSKRYYFLSISITKNQKILIDSK